MVLMQPQVSGLVPGTGWAAGERPWVRTGSTGSTRVPLVSGHTVPRGCAHCPSLQGRHSPNVHPGAVQDWGAAPVPGHAGLFLAKQTQRGVPVLVLSRVGMAFPMSLLWRCIHHVHSAPWGQYVFPCAMVSPMSPVPSLLSLLRDCAGQEEPPAQSPFHPNPLQLLLLPWPLGAACEYGDNAWPVPTHPSPVPAGLGTQLALLWQQPEVPECHHLLLHPCPSQCSAASPTAEPSG